MITFKDSKHHWNYFLALENDLEKVSRYIEFSNDNLMVYSIELTHILLSASSDVDVVLRLLCELVEKRKHAKNIVEYRDVIKSEIPDLSSEEIFIPRFGLNYKPWLKWLGTENPDWWRSYNQVKHERNLYYREANLQHTINAVGGLLIVIVYYYKYLFSKESNSSFTIKQTTRNLRPESNFIQLNNAYYHSTLIL